ncbi:MAG: Holliday junction branch migration protein RuvA [Ruminococcaceae bacterium]|nr:Holliday junction branch migration protein RuvA [Oscillospiraceae bacterium]
MFYYISGKLAALESSFAVVDAGGVGYKMTISQNTYSAMPPHRSVTEAPTVKLYSYMAVREDDVELFGFISQEELSAFKMLITVSGVGPKAAISILSQLSPSKLAVAICTEDKKAIAQSNGIGPKTAARIILELKDKLKNTVIDDADDSDSPVVSVASGSKMSDAQDALAVLGYSKSEALSALRGIDLGSLELDEIIKLALKKLMR